ALLTAATEIRANCKPGPEDREEAWRCEVKLDSEGPVAVVRVREALRGPLLLAGSLDGPDGAEVAALAESDKFASLRCSLVVPSKPNTCVLETSILDYFAFTDRAVALKVNRGREFAPVRELKGRHTAEAARQAMSALHCGWAMSGGGIVHEAGNPGALLEVSPLLSYEGEGLGTSSSLRGVDLDGSLLKLPLHLSAPGEDPMTLPVAGGRAGGKASEASEAVDCLDTRPFYLQEYPLRPQMSRSAAPQLKKPRGAQ
ncbi:unnamed protein product, partial [Polarella glacialis]